MEPIWIIAEEMGVRLLTDPEWVYDPGAWYGEAGSTSFILLPAVIPIRLERWLIAHELGHHANPIYREPEWLAEAKADRWAVKTLWALYEEDEVEWPRRRVVETALKELRGQECHLAS